MTLRTSLVLMLLAAACDSAGTGGGAPAESPTIPEVVDTSMASDLPTLRDVPPDIAAGPALAVGYGEADITPVFEPYTDENGNRRWDDGEPFEDLDEDGEIDTLWLGGFGPRQPTGVHDPLYARSVALRLGGTLYVFTALDTLGAGMGRLAAVKSRAIEAAGAEAGLVAERIVVASTHSHHTPDTTGIFGPDELEGAWDPDYLEQLTQGGADSILAAIQALEPAELVVTSAEAGEGYVRDIDPPEILDPYVGIVQARRPADGSPLVTLVSIANHPEAAWKDNTRITADYPYFLRERFEAEVGGKLVYFSGALGLMQSPAKIGEEGFERAQLIGEAYADVVAAALDGKEPLAAEELVGSHAATTVTVAMENLALLVAVENDIAEGYKGFLYRTQTGLCKTMGCIDLPISALRIGDAVTFVSLPGEFTPELIVGGIVSPPDYSGDFPDAPAEPVLSDHLQTRERFLMGLADAEVGYVFPKMTYEPSAHFSQQHGPGPNVAGQLMPGLVGLLQQVNE